MSLYNLFISSALASAAYECVPKAGWEEMRPYCDIGNAAESTCMAYFHYCDWKPSDGTSTTPENNCIAKPNLDDWSAYCGILDQNTCTNTAGTYCQWSGAAPTAAPTQPPVVTSPPTTTDGSNPNCVVKPGLEEYSAYCTLGINDESICRTYGYYCEWVVDSSSIPEKQCVVKPGMEEYVDICNQGNMSESTCNANNLVCDWKGEGSSSGGSSGGSSKCVAAPGFESSYEEWCNTYTSFGQNQCDNGTNGFCQWA